MRGFIGFFLLIVLVVAEDKFIFELELDCGYHQREKYNYNVQFFETDSFLSPNDLITNQKIGEARPGVAKIVVEGAQYGDEIESSGYTVKMLLFHDCTEYEKEVRIDMEILPLCEIGKGLCRYKIVKDIKDAFGNDKQTAKLSYE